MISAQTRSAFVARENGYALFRIMLYSLTSASTSLRNACREPPCE